MKSYSILFGILIGLAVVILGHVIKIGKKIDKMNAKIELITNK